MSETIDREKIERQVEGLKYHIKNLQNAGIDADYLIGEAHGLEMVLEGFYLKD